LNQSVPTTWLASRKTASGISATTAPTAGRPVASSTRPATITAPASTSPAAGVTQSTASAKTEATIATTTGIGMLARLLMDVPTTPPRPRGHMPPPGASQSPSHTIAA
jgi:hypothetical protein